MTIDKLIERTIENNKFGLWDSNEDTIEANERLDQICNELRNAIVPVKVMSDGDGHNYIIPNHRIEEFEINLTDTDFINSGRFDDKWNKFSTGGCINNKQLYAITTDI